MKTKILTTKHKQHYEIHSKFRPYDGRQMVNTISNPILWSKI